MARRARPSAVGHGSDRRIQPRLFVIYKLTTLILPLKGNPAQLRRLRRRPRLVRGEEHGDDGCRLYLEHVRWPYGVECPRCSSSDVLWLDRRRRHHCRGCRYQFRVTARTVFHDSHLSLPKWFLAISLMLSSESGFSAAQLQRVLGGSYKSAWFLEHRIRSARWARRTSGARRPRRLPRRRGRPVSAGRLRVVARSAAGTGVRRAAGLAACSAQ